MQAYTDLIFMNIRPTSVIFGVVLCVAILLWGDSSAEIILWINKHMPHISMGCN